MGRLTIYKNCKIIEEENLILNDDYHHTNIFSYLSSFSNAQKTIFTKVQLIQNKLDIEIKLQLSQYDALMFTPLGYNYAKYQYNDIESINDCKFYFIRKAEMVAPNCVRLYLHLDVLNSFPYTASSQTDIGYFKFSKLTHITRQHKDRFKKTGDVWHPYIDEFSEGLNPILYKKDFNVVNESLNGGSSYIYNRSFYLVYETPTSESQPNVICKIFADNGSSIRIGTRTSTNVETFHYLDAINTIDRKDSKLIKIFKLPYFPCNPIDYKVDSGITCPVFSTEDIAWHVTGGDAGYLFRSNNAIDKPFINGENDANVNQIGTISDNLYELNPLMQIDMSDITKSLTDTRAQYQGYYFEEPKLFHSDFYYWKYIYDSFVKVVANEKYLNRYQYSARLTYERKIAFTFTSTINSRFMFYFSFFDSYNFNTDDYEKVLIIQRSNEQTIYNEEYFNYLKMGYNYDVKNKNRQEAMSWFTTGVGLTAGVLSLAFGSKTLGAGLIASSVLSIANSINTTIQLETNIEQKLTQLKNQSASVQGSDDVDLMSEYSHHNKLWRAKYEVSDRMKKCLSDLFYYTGYNDDVNEIPNVSTRKWFNFLQCEPHFKYVNGITTECLDELIKKYKGGVTILHRNTINDSYVWDFEREKENWESFFFS